MLFFLEIDGTIGQWTYDFSLIWFKLAFCNPLNFRKISFILLILLTANIIFVMVCQLLFLWDNFDWAWITHIMESVTAMYQVKYLFSKSDISNQKCILGIHQNYSSSLL